MMALQSSDSLKIREDLVRKKIRGPLFSLKKKVINFKGPLFTQIIYIIINL